MHIRPLISVTFVLFVSGCSALTPQASSDNATLPSAKITRARAGTLTTLYSFQGQPDGAHPQERVSVYHLCTNVCATLLFGNTSAGGTNNVGTIYSLYRPSLTSGGAFTEKVRLSYLPSTTGSDPMGAVVARSYYGPIFGTASKGGADGKGTVVELPGPKGANAVRSFDGHNGASPTGLAGYGGYPYYTAAFAGGLHNLGAIVLIRVAHNNLRRPEVLYSFSGTSDGEHPNSEPRIYGDFDSPFYGTTAGSKTVPPTVYEFVPGQGLVTLYTFATSEIGVTPTGVTPFEYSSRKILLIGTTLSGGSSGYGTLYELKPQGSTYALVTLHTFAGGTVDGAYPYGPPTYIGGKKTDFYVVTGSGGSKGCGTIVTYDLKSSEYGLFHSFKCGKDGAHPEAPLTSDTTYGNLIYGTTSAGGTADRGVVFSFTPP